MKIKQLLFFSAMAAGLAINGAQADNLTGTLQKISDSGTITIGHRESSIPFSYLDNEQNPVGYSIDICMKIVDDIEKEVGKDLNIRYVPVNPKTRIPLMANGTIDLECGATTNTLTRQQQVEYLPTTFITGTKLLVKKSSGISSISDMDGKVIGIAQGTTNERAIKAKIEELGLDLKILPVRDHIAGFLSLNTDRVDAYSTDHIQLFGLISKAKNPDEFEVVGKFLSFDPYGIMLRRDDSAFELVGKKTLSELFRSGEIHTIYDKWFSPLGVPSTDLLNTAFQLQTLPR